jgi:hypothetical protein
VAEATVAASKGKADNSEHWKGEITRLKSLKRNLVRMRGAEEILSRNLWVSYSIA